jgi:hypothetical protein
MVPGRRIWGDVLGEVAGITLEYQPAGKSFCSLYFRSSRGAITIQLREDEIQVNLLLREIPTGRDAAPGSTVILNMGAGNIPLTVRFQSGELLSTAYVTQTSPRTVRVPWIRSMMESTRISFTYQQEATLFVDLVEGHLAALMVEECLHRADAANGYLH